MCGRFTLATPPEQIRRYFGYAEQPNFPPRYNIAPTQPVAIVRSASGARQFALVRWGLLPPWVKDVKGFPLLINARSEEAAGKPAFRNAMRRRRCLVPADGFYEWQAPAASGGRKAPFAVRRPDGGPFAFAGLWELYSDADGNEIETAAILTGAANHTLAPIHHRSPVVIEPADFDRWLDVSSDSVEPVADLLRPPPDDFFTAFAVSTRVNAVANDDPGLILPVEGEAIPPQARLAEPARRSDPGDDQLKLL